MGTWGTGNFDADSAVDFRQRVIRNLVDQARVIVANPELLSVGGDGERALMPLVAIIHSICRSFIGTPPAPAEVLEWKAKYLEVYDREMPELADRDFVNARRIVVAGTFDDLIELGRERERSRSRV